MLQVSAAIDGEGEGDTSAENMQAARARAALRTRRRLLIFVTLVLLLGCGSSVWLAVEINGSALGGPLAPRTLDGAVEDTVLLLRTAGGPAGLAGLLLVLSPFIALLCARFATREGLPSAPLSMATLCRCRVYLLWLVALVIPPGIAAISFFVVHIMVGGESTELPLLTLANGTDAPPSLPSPPSYPPSAPPGASGGSNSSSSGGGGGGDGADGWGSTASDGIAPWLLLGGTALAPLPLLPVFVSIESGFRGYLQPRLRSLFASPRVPVYFSAALAPFITLPLTLTGQLLGDAEGGTILEPANNRYLAAPFFGTITVALLQLLVSLVSGYFALADPTTLASALLVGSATCTTCIAAIAPSLIFPASSIAALSPYNHALAFGVLLPLWALLAVVGLACLPRWERMWGGHGGNAIGIDNSGLTSSALESRKAVKTHGVAIGMDAAVGSDDAIESHNVAVGRHAVDDDGSHDAIGGDDVGISMDDEMVDEMDDGMGVGIGGNGGDGGGGGGSAAEWAGESEGPQSSIPLGRERSVDSDARYYHVDDDEERAAEETAEAAEVGVDVEEAEAEAEANADAVGPEVQEEAQEADADAQAEVQADEAEVQAEVEEAQVQADEAQMQAEEAKVPARDVEAHLETPASRREARDARRRATLSTATTAATPMNSTLQPTLAAQATAAQATARMTEQAKSRYRHRHRP